MGSTKPTQADLYYQSVRKTAEGNLLFLDMVAEGTMTKKTLAALLKRRPAQWGRFAGFLSVLPD